MVHLVYQVTDLISGCNLLFQMRQNDLPLAISTSLQEIPLFLFKKKKKQRYRILGGETSIQADGKSYKYVSKYIEEDINNFVIEDEVISVSGYPDHM